jgi:hypothetical protein
VGLEPTAKRLLALSVLTPCGNVHPEGEARVPWAEILVFSS